MRRRAGGRSRRGTAIGFLVGLAAAACAPDNDRIVVGSKNFSEQDLLGEIVAQWIEATTEIGVERRLHLGGTFIAHRALQLGEIDLYPEYTGTALTAILERPPDSDPDSVFRRVADVYASRWDLRWLPPLGFENTFAMLVRSSMADSLDIETLSDLARFAPELTAGFGYEFMERADGFSGLTDRYDLAFAAPPREMDLGLIYRAVAAGRIDLTAGNSTDGRIEALSLRVLEDDRGYFPPYEAAIVVREDALEAHPGLEGALRELSGRIDTPTMRRLNRAVDLEGRPVRDVAADWVASRLEPGGLP
ncbi:MAG: glycine betaine ABC transporter substrate-binding protein [Gemmatimonadota bacterium]|nr:glycine betaine ABC transporter substrate-binding protein [Gemmatimonadota bacterium]